MNELLIRIGIGVISFLIGVGIAVWLIFSSAITKKEWEDSHE
jgi:hypothetical protein